MRHQLLPDLKDLVHMLRSCFVSGSQNTEDGEEFHLSKFASTAQHAATLVLREIRKAMQHDHHITTANGVNQMLETRQDMRKTTSICPLDAPVTTVQAFGDSQNL